MARTSMRRVDGAVMLHPEEAATIRRAVKLVLDGESLRAVCKRLDAEHVPTPGNAARWDSTMLKQLLLRPSLAGLTVHRGQVVGRTPDDSPRVIDEDTHERIKALLTDPARRVTYAGREPRYLLGGIARCGRPTGALDDAGEPVRCGGRMVRSPGRLARLANGNTKRQPPSYTCSACNRVRRIQDRVDELVELAVIEWLSRPNAAGAFTTGDPAALQEARDTIEALDARLANAADMFATGDIDAAQLTRITERLRADRAVAAAAVQAALPAAVPAELVGPKARQVWDTLSMDAKRAVVSELATVTILPSGSGKSWDPETVQVVWKS